MSQSAVANYQSHQSDVGHDYLALMDCSAPDGWMPIAERELADWLRTKRNWDVDFSDDGEYADGSRSLQVLRHNANGGHSLRARLIERDTPKGTWTTELLALDKRGDGDWIRLSTTNDQGNFVAVPKLARNLMSSLPLGDGRVQYVDGPVVFDSGRVSELLDLLADPQRKTLLFVAGSDTESDIPFDPFVRQVGHWTREVYGLGQVLVLDPAATAAFNAKVGAFATRPWTIRTFLPRVDFERDVDSRRHRFLTLPTLIENRDFYIQNLLGRVARSHAQREPAPTEVLRLRRTFDRLAARLLIPSAPTLESVAQDGGPSEALRPPVAASAKIDEVPAISADRGMIPPTAPLVGERELAQMAALLGIPDLDATHLTLVKERLALGDEALRRLQDAEERIRSLLDDAAEREEGLDDELIHARSALDSAQLDYAEISQELSSANDRMAYLTAKLREAEDYHSAYADVPDDWRTDYPQTLVDVVDRMASLADGRIRFTGGLGPVEQAEATDTLGNACRDAWDALLTLEDYLDAKGKGECAGGVHTFLKGAAGIKRIAVGRHASRESESTMNKYGQLRVFPVPAEVDRSGAATMAAHFKLAQIGMVSPRMHYLDDSAGATGCIYIGYIGPHLTTVSTN